MIETIRESKNKLEHLELKGTYANEKIMIEISKINSLKSLKVIDTRRVMITPEVVHALAQNENQLEIFEFNDFDPEEHYFEDGIDLDDYKYQTEMNIALNSLLEKKAEKLKIFKKNYAYQFCKENGKRSCFPLKKFALCQNLEEFCGKLHGHDIAYLSKLTNLKKLSLGLIDFKNQHLKSIFDGTNFSQLKYLSIKPYVNEKFCEKLTNHFFPNLERFHISSDRLNEEDLRNLIKNAPKLRSIQLDRPILEISNQSLYEIFKNSNILVIFGKNGSKDGKQSSFEEFLIETDLFRKYHRMKKNFEKWCDNNPEYGS